MEHELNTFPEGHAFIVNHARFTTAETGDGLFTIIIRNESNAWVTPEVHREDEGFSSPHHHVEHGEHWTTLEPIQIYKNDPSYMKRWRPGLFGVAGDGGGVVRFTVPGNATSAILDVTVVG
jgi:hypothetical protein